MPINQRRKNFGDFRSFREKYNTRNQQFPQNLYFRRLMDRFKKGFWRDLTFMKSLNWNVMWVGLSFWLFRNLTTLLAIFH